MKLHLFRREAARNVLYSDSFGARLFLGARSKGVKEVQESRAIDSLSASSWQRSTSSWSELSCQEWPEETQLVLLVWYRIFCSRNRTSKDVFRTRIMTTACNCSLLTVINSVQWGDEVMDTWSSAEGRLAESTRASTAS